jgi:hypothetical protein
MHNVTNQDGLVSIESPIDELGSIVSEMISLIEHVRGGIAAIETEIMREQRCSNRDDVVNVIIMNDVTPRHLPGPPRRCRRPRFAAVRDFKICAKFSRNLPSAYCLRMIVSESGR